MPLVVVRKPVPDSTSKAEHDGSRGAQTKPRRRRGGFPAPVLQRKPVCACGGGCPRCKAEYPIAAASETVPPIIHEVLSSPGQPLDMDTRAFMEPRFGYDFGQVRVHTDAKAAQSARAVSALAYTVGRDVVFAEGRYDPGTRQGRKLLTHELTHTIQQSRFASGTVPPQGQIAIGPSDTVLERAAEGSGGRLASGREVPALSSGIALQRAPDDPDEGEIQSYVFAGDKRLSTDKNFALTRGLEIAARIRKSGRLSRDVRLELNGMLAFFQGEAKEVYIKEIKPALVEATAGGGQEGSGSRWPPTSLDNIVKHPNYIDNNMKEINFYTAELAVIKYRDGSSLELGLVPRWMEPPFEEVDYHTPPEGYRRLFNPKEGTGFFREAELQDVPRNMQWADVQEFYSHHVSFVVEPKSGRIVPTRVNTLTAPTLCKVLLDSEMKFVNQTKQAAAMGEEVAGIMVWWAGAGGWAKGPGMLIKGVGTRAAARWATSPAARKLAGELDDLLRTGASKTITVEGVEFAGVEVSRQGSRLAVSRYSSQIAPALRGRGLGGRVNAAFEEAAVTAARMNGLKTVTIDVGMIVNPGWRVYLESRGYVRTMVNNAYGGFSNNWIKTITL